jgi:glucose/arabinose dehydrogenase/mono/diheme cytochrome c family protein
MAVTIRAALVPVALTLFAVSSAHAADAGACPGEDPGITLAPGFCATVFADGIGHARQMAVAKDGVVYVNTWSGRYFGNDKPHDGGFIVALKDSGGKGKADVIERFGDTPDTGGAGGTGVALYDGHVYAENKDKIVRYKLTPGSIAPKGELEVVLSGMPLTGDHPMHPFVIDTAGNLFVDIASATNSCQEKNRQLKSPGIKPCTELETRGGIWRYDAKKLDQKFSPAERYATGIRNADGIALDASGRGLFATQHGRDQLSQNWPDLYKPEQGPTLPAEELLAVKQGGDYGWPFCYYDQIQKKLVLAPEYGGDGGKATGECASKLGPIAWFPAHWAPNGLAIYTGKQFPARYRDGAFIAFHGSWNRAPYPQQGFKVVFQSLSKGEASGTCEIFADGFAGDGARADRRPSGVVVAPDGALFISDDIKGRIYRVTYHGGAAANAKATPCPAADASPGEIASAGGRPPEGTRANAGASTSIPLAPGATREMVELGNQLYHGQGGGGTCVGCHGADGSGTEVGPNLVDAKWLWGDGSMSGIAKSITDGVAQPKEYRAPMPPLGGAQLSADQVNAIAAYLWGLSHR